MTTLDFWFDFASPYAYLSAMRIGAIARAAGVELGWRPFLLGPIFAERGWSTSPFVLYPDKGRYLWRDVEREATHAGLAFRKPTVFPMHSVLAARVGLVAADGGWIEAFATAAFDAAFARDRDLAVETEIDDAIARAGGDAADVRARAIAPETRARLRDQVDAARALGIFGAPTFVVRGELYWGNDRLERAIDAARARGEAE